MTLLRWNLGCSTQLNSSSWRLRRIPKCRPVRELGPASALGGTSDQGELRRIGEAQMLPEFCLNHGMLLAAAL